LSALATTTTPRSRDSTRTSRMFLSCLMASLLETAALGQYVHPLFPSRSWNAVELERSAPSDQRPQPHDAPGWLGRDGNTAAAEGRECEMLWQSGTRVALGPRWPPGVAQLSIRADEGGIVTQVFDARMSLQVVADRVAEQRAADGSPFALLLPNLRRSFATAEDLQVSIRDAGLEPHGVINVVSLSVLHKNCEISS